MEEQGEVEERLMGGEEQDGMARVVGKDHRTSEMSCSCVDSED